MDGWRERQIERGKAREKAKEREGEGEDGGRERQIERGRQGRNRKRGRVSERMEGERDR